MAGVMYGVVELLSGVAVAGRIQVRRQHIHHTTF